MASSSSNQKVISALHLSRMQPYLEATHQNQKKALQLYRWNLELTAATQSVLGVMEVVLRNAMDQQMQEWNTLNSGGASWLLEPPASPLRSLIADKRSSALSRARKESAARAAGHPRFGAEVTHDDVLAQIMFGLWKDLLPNHALNAGTNQSNDNRRRMWEECLEKAFPNVQDPDGEETYWRVVRMHRLRNRVSHMEPLLNLNVEEQIKDAFRIVRSIDHDVANWVSGANKVPGILKSRHR